ncbi:universal stress protein [Actinomadura nitritigenes]|uniref:universal stress protein n=1 Tax=Actinomadura nitritigenes TaxID=134602 RepID=UPI003D8CD0C6
MGVPIVIGTDGSDEAARALDWAAAEAVSRERPLHIVHATESRPNTTPLFARSGTAEPTTCVGRKVLAAAGLRMAERSTVRAHRRSRRSRDQRGARRGRGGAPRRRASSACLVPIAGGLTASVDGVVKVINALDYDEDDGARPHRRRAGRRH